ncbi:MAG: hypothetical protein ACQESK_00160 [Bacteroidota bacterium]
MIDKKKVISNVAKLLQEVPTSMEIVKDDAKKEQRFQYLAKYMVEKALREDALIVSEDYSGIAILFRMGQKKESFWKELLDDLKLAINVTGISKGLKALKAQQVVKKQRPNKGQYLYCWFWGILSDSRGMTDKKTAFRMKDQFFELSHETKLPIYAETRIRRVSLAYQRYGFEKLKEWKHPSGDTMTFLKYDPAKQKIK